LPLDIKEMENGYQIQAPVPGFKPEEVDVTFADGVLKIEASHTEQSAREQGGYLRREVAYGNFQRTIQLPGDVKEDEITASFEDGMLTIAVPKVPRAQPKKIQVTKGKQNRLAGTTS
jgi:HSP20 family protein